MMISRLYNRGRETTGRESSAGNSMNGAINNDPRIITTQNIPIFILPKRLDEIHNQTNKTSNLKTRDSLEDIRDDRPTASDYRRKCSQPFVSVEAQRPSISESFNNNLRICGTAVRSNSLFGPKMSLSDVATNVSTSMHNLKAASSISKSTTKSLMKTLFHSGLMNIAPENTNDERKFRENYCDLWVLHGGTAQQHAHHPNSHCDSDTTNNSRRESYAALDQMLSPTASNYMSKSMSILNKKAEGDYLNKSRTEEKLQRDYLVNLSHQLHTEQTSEPRLTPDKHNKHKNKNNANPFNWNKFRRQRCKSDTFISFNAICKDIETNKSLLAAAQAACKSTQNSRAGSQLFSPSNTESRRSSFKNYFFKSNHSNSNNNNNHLSSQADKSVHSDYLKSRMRTSSSESSVCNSKMAFQQRPQVEIRMQRASNSDSDFAYLSKPRRSSQPYDSHEASNRMMLRYLGETTAGTCGGFGGNNNSDSECDSDLDKVFNKYYENNRTYKKAKSISRFPSPTTMSLRSGNTQILKNNSLLEPNSHKPLNTRKWGFLNVFKAINKSRTEHEKDRNLSLNNRIAFPLDTNKNNNNKPETKSSSMVTRRRTLFQKSKNFSQFSSVGSDIAGGSDLYPEFDLITPALKKIELTNPANFDVANLNLALIEKALKKHSVLSKANEDIYLKLNRSLMNRIAPLMPLKLPSAVDEGTNSHFASRSNISRSLNLNDSFLNSGSNFLGLRNSKVQVFAYLDVSIERVAQQYDSHVLSISLQNLRVQPLFEINYIKSKLSYLTIQPIDVNSLIFAEESNKDNTNNATINDNESLSTSPPGSPAVTIKSAHSPLRKHNRPCLQKNPTKPSNSQHQQQHKPKYYVKITRHKALKCKFNANNRSFQKPVDFVLAEEHFLKTTEEAVALQMQKNFKNSPNDSETMTKKQRNKQQQKQYDNPFANEMALRHAVSGTSPSPGGFKKQFMFLFSIELHSYIPISRKTLSSTFRKKKRIFKGQFQISENFITNTQFTKRFELYEI